MAEIFFNPPKPSSSSVESQLENFQTTLASVNQHVIILQETLQERDQQIADLKIRLSEYTETSQTTSGSTEAEKPPRVDETLTILGLLIKLYRLVLPPGKDSAVPLVG